MKQLSLLFTFLLIVGQTHSQDVTDPENIIIQYDQKGERKILYKDQISANPDSFDISIHPEILDMYSTELSEIEKLLIGTWTYQSSERTNNQDGKIKSPTWVEYLPNHRFIQVFLSDTVQGNWSISMEDETWLNWKYDQKVLMIEKEIAAILDEQSLKSLYMESNRSMIYIINQNELILSIASPIGNFHNRIILMKYKREK